MRIKSYLYLALMLLLVSCHDRHMGWHAPKPVAIVGDVSLFEDEICESMPQGLDSLDSCSFAERYIDKWLRRQVRLREAASVFSSSAHDIEKLVEQYRQSLLLDRLDQNYIANALDTVLTQSQIESYYRDHSAEFKLDRAVAKWRLVRLDKDFDQSKKLLSLLNSKGEREGADLSSLCEKNGFEFVDNSQNWSYYSNMLDMLPLVRGAGREYSSYLTRSGVQQLSDEEFSYYFIIDNYLKAGAVAPLEIVDQRVRDILLARRKMQMALDYEQQLYDAAMERGEIEVVEAEKDKEPWFVPYYNNDL